MPSWSTPLDDFLAGADATSAAAHLERLGVVVATVGALLALGVLAFLRFVWSPDVGSRRRLEATAAVGGVVAVVGAVLQAIGTASVRGEGVVDVLTGDAGAGVMMRAVGGAWVVLGLADRSGSSAAARAPASHRGWTPPATASFAVSGAVLAALSFAFDGHTVSRGPRVIHALTDVVHVGAGSVWFGGLSALAVLAVGRTERPVSWTTLLHRFSVVATVALTAVAGAGVVLAVFVLDAPGDLFGTDWGRTLIVKSALVAIAASIGAYQHFVIVPRLPGSDRAARVAVLVEATALLTVVVTTGLLTTASTQ